MKAPGAMAAMVVAGVLAACAPADRASPRRDDGTARMLPSWKARGSALVADLATPEGDLRAQHPEWYAITRPPVTEGFRAVGEWEPMRTILLSYRGFDGPLQEAGDSMLQMIREAADRVDFTVVVPGDAVREDVVDRLVQRGLAMALIDQKVHFLAISLDSVWAIDFGPQPLVEAGGTMAFADFRYYSERILDDRLPTVLGGLWGLTTYRAPLDFEGGNFASDGEGTCYTSQAAFWDNADKTEAQVAEVFRRYLGCRQLVTLIPEEDGTGHIDMFSKLVSPGVFLVGRSTLANSDEKTVADLDANAAILGAVVRADGSRLAVRRIPMPFQRDATAPVWRTYTNSTFANGVNLVPVYPGHREDEAEAMAAWREVLPDWDHVGIDSERIITWGGALHCLSRPVPAGTLAKWVPDGTCREGRCLAPATGYDGGCQADADCTGPGWECAANDCGNCGYCPTGEACDGDGICRPTGAEPVPDVAGEDGASEPAPDVPAGDGTEGVPLADVVEAGDAVPCDRDGLPGDAVDRDRSAADAAAGDPGPRPTGSVMGGCASGPAPSRTSGLPWLLVGVAAFLAVRLVYTTTRD